MENPVFNINCIVDYGIVLESTVLYGSSTVGSDRCSTGTAKFSGVRITPPSLFKQGERALSLQAEDRGNVLAYASCSF